MASFLDKYNGFVLKLKIKTVDAQSHIRRVPLSRIADVRGNISYEELIDLVLVFSQLEGSNTPLNTKTHSVTLRYYDDEKDLITLASTVELKEAIELFAEQRFMRITTSVKPNTLCTRPNRRGTIILNRVTNGRSDVDKNVCPTVAKPPPTMTKEKPSNGKMIGRKNEGQQLKGAKADEVPSYVNTGKNKTSRPSNTVLPSSNIKGIPSEATEQESREPPRKSKEPKTDVLVPFIHGRHTCDGCLTTPIIGIRYHSTNLTDYDLCQKCYDNYGGSAIKYEAVELKRDLAFQHRWRQRHANTMRLRELHSTNYRVRVATRQSNSTPSRVDGDRLPSCHHVPTSANHATQSDVSNSNDFDDLLKEAIRRSLEDVVPREALKNNESLEKKSDSPNQKSFTVDSVPQINATETVNKTSGLTCDPPNQESTPNMFVPNEYSKKTIEMFEVKHDYNKEDSNKKVSEKNISAGEDKDDAKGDYEKEDLIEEKVAEMDIRDKDKDNLPRSVEIVKERAVDVDNMEYSNEAIESKRISFNEKPLMSRNESMVVDKPSKNLIPNSVGIVEQKVIIEPPTSNSMTSGESSSSLQLKEVETMRRAMDTDSVDSEKLISESSEQLSLERDTDHVPRNIHSKLGDFDNSKDTSFSLDAAGNGEVAEAMGKTLDTFAGVISEMLSEAEVQLKPTETNEVLSSKSNPGEIILNSSDDDNMIDEVEDDTEWSVVNSIGSNGTTESEQIGKAAEMLGSALFNSVMNNAAEDNRYDMAGSGSSFSIPSSVPTDPGTVVSDISGQNQDNRWAQELEKLRELGFETDTICIEILEKICSESDAATNIDRVVNELLSLDA